MVMYKHRNCGNGIIGVFDTKNNLFTLKPGQECIIDRKIEQSGVKVIEEIHEEQDTQKEEKFVPDMEPIVKKNKYGGKR